MFSFVIASPAQTGAAIQLNFQMDCFVTFVPRNDKQGAVNDWMVGRVISNAPLRALQAARLLALVKRPLLDRLGALSLSNGQAGRLRGGFSRIAPNPTATVRGSAVL